MAVSSEVWRESDRIDVIATDVAIYPTGNELFLVQDIDTTKLGVISISGTDGNYVAIEVGNINGGDFCVVAARPTRVWQRGEFFTPVSGAVNIRRGGVVDGIGIIGGDDDINDVVLNITDV